MNKFTAACCWALMVGILIGAIAYERMIWNECRETNSFWYCMKVLSR